MCLVWQLSSSPQQVSGGTSSLALSPPPHHLFLHQPTLPLAPLLPCATLLSASMLGPSPLWTPCWVLCCLVSLCQVPLLSMLLFRIPCCPGSSSTLGPVLPGASALSHTPLWVFCYPGSCARSLNIPNIAKWVPDASSAFFAWYSILRRVLSPPPPMLNGKEKPQLGIK